MTSIPQNLAHIQSQITAYAQKYSRNPTDIQLIAVSKGQSIEKIQQAYEAGQTTFAENYLQEALDKIKQLKAQPIEWHYIGRIQRNKTRKIAENFAWVQSVCDKNIATRLNDQRPAHLPPLSICLQVNVSQENSKAGVDINAVTDLAKHCLSLTNLKLRGLMAIPAIKSSLAEQRTECHKMYLIWLELKKLGYNFDILSMGMSDDMEAAIAEGSTLVRIGTAIFGKRI